MEGKRGDKAGWDGTGWEKTGYAGAMGELEKSIESGY
jgi:hypothetical protein